MNISSTSLFHFTSKFETLTSILKNDFIAQFSIESFLGIISDDNTSNLDKGVLMVSFCDIPLSNTLKHTKLYGSYAIGISKEWAFKNKINPVIYSYPKSHITEAMYNLTMKLIDDPTEENFENYNILAKIIQYVKPYSGNFKKNGKLYKNVRFYDEREWRYIPKLVDKIEISWLKKTEGKELNPSNVNKNLLLQKKFPNAILKFNSKDIKHIIVKSEKEIPKMIKFLNTIKTDKYTVNDIQLLMTKIISMDRIIDDY